MTRVAEIARTRTTRTAEPQPDLRQKQRSITYNLVRASLSGTYVFGCQTDGEGPDLAGVEVDPLNVLGGGRGRGRRRRLCGERRQER